MIRGGIVCVWAAIWLFVATSSTHAREPATPLTLREVLVSVDATHPDLEIATESVSQAQAVRDAARGQWDTSVHLGYAQTLAGYYQNSQVDINVRQATPLWGVGVYAGYRLGLGDYPAYRGYLQTRSAGEVRAGIDIPLWKGGPIDPARAKIETTQLKADAATCDRREARLEVSRKAALAYWKWVAYGLEVKIQQDLLVVAQARDAGLREKAALGDIPSILVVDNERLVLDRQAKLIEAEQAFARATIDLSLLVRDSSKIPLQIGAERLPDRIRPSNEGALGPEDPDVEQALAQRPELCAIDRKRAAAAVELRLARNQRAPAIHARGFVSRDFGEGAPELQPTEVGAGVHIEAPLLFREARGEYRAASAQVRQIDVERRRLRDQIVAEVRQARIDLAAAQRTVDVMKQQVAAARTLAEAEREKFRAGASDLVIVNLRELASAEAERQQVEALAAYQQAKARYLVSLGRDLGAS